MQQSSTAAGAFARSVGHRFAAWASLWLLVALVWSSAASAQHTSPSCPPQTATVANGGSVEIDITDCDPYNFGFGNGPPVYFDAPDHGSALLRQDFLPPSTAVSVLTYTHNGNSATSDTFVIEDLDLFGVQFTITISPATSAIVVSPAALPAMKVAVPFSQTLSSTGGTGPYTYTLNSGALPVGLSLTSAGVLSGTPTQRASYNFTVRSQDSLGAFTLKTYTGTIADPDLNAAPTPTTLIQGVVSTFQYTGVGGNAPYSFSISSGSFPPGITLETDGRLTGTPTASGTFNVQLVVNDSTTDPACPGCDFFDIVPVVVNVSPAPSVSIAVAPASVSEDGATNLVYTVTRSANLSAATVVNLTTTGTATSGVDYTGGVATATIPSGATTATVTINPTVDGTVEANETVILTVAAGTGYTVGAPASATGTILNDDVPSASIAVAPASVSEDGATNLVYTITLSQASLSATSVGFTVTGTATFGTDYAAAPSPLVIPAGTTTGTYLVDPAADATIEANETVIVTLAAGAGYTVGAPNSATGTILNDDLPNLTINDVTANEGNAGTTNFTFTVSLSAPAGPGGVTFDIATANGTASSGVDYVANSLTGQTIPAGSSTYSFTVQGNGDTLNEPSETFFVNVTNVTNAVVVDGQGVGTLTNDDPLPSISIDDVTVVEGNSGTALFSFTISLNTASGQNISVNYATADGTATAPADYTANSGTLVFAPGQTSNTLIIQANGEVVPEANETFFVNLSGAVNATIADNQGVGTITNDDVPVTVNPGTLPNGAVAAAYSQSLSGSGGVAPYTFAVTAGAVPAGLTLSPAGVLSGTPTAGGSFNFTVSATDSSPFPGPFSGSQAYTLVIAPATISLPATPLAGGTLGAAYSAAITPASGGTSPYAYAVTAGALPGGLTVNATTGAITGTPSALGTFNFSLTATDSSTGSGPYAATQAYSIVVIDNPPVANSGTLTVAYSAPATPVTLNITGGTATSVAIATTAVNGTAIATGTSITYQPTAGFAGSDSFTYTATNSGGTSAPATITVTVNDAVITITAGGALTTTVAVPYTQTFTFNGGAQPWSSYQVTNLPAGLSITGTTANTVTVSGTPTQAGSFSLNVSATDSSTGNGPYTPGEVFVLTVAAPGLTLAPAGGTSVAPYGVAFSQTYTAAGGIGPYTYARTGSLPPGLSFSGDTLSGTPTAPGSYSFTITATDTGSTGSGSPFSVAQNYTLNVPAPTIVVNPATLPDATAGTAYGQTLSATGGVGPYSFAVTAGALPAGLTLGTGGNLAGTPTASGTFNFTVTGTDANGQTGSRAYTLIVAVPVLTMTPPTLPSGTVGVAYSQAFAATGGQAPYSFAVTAGALPGGLTLATGGTLSGTPTTAGSFNFTVTATDSTGGTAATVSQAYTMGIINAPPVSVDDTATVLAGQSVTIAVTANDTSIAPITGISIVTAPAQGTAVVSGLNIVYTAPTTAPPTVSFTYLATGPGGNSAPATVTVTVNPLPVPASFDVTTAPATPVQVLLTAGATGGPFTGADIVSVTPASSGTAAITSTAAGFVLTYTPNAAFSGAVVVQFTLDNAFATSVIGTVNITVEERPDPSQDAEVQGLIDAQSEATRRFATGQISNFQQRLERLHRSGNAGGVENGIGFALDRPCIEPLAGRSIDPCRDNRRAGQGSSAQGAGLAAAGDGSNSGNGGNGPLGVWTGGMIRSGSQDGRDGNGDISFETDGLSTGVDYRVNDALVIGGGFGYGRDDNEIGRNGSRVDGSARTVALYASYHPGAMFFVDTLVGYQQLDFDLDRYVTATGGLVSGQRDGDQWFASVSVGADIVREQMTFTPYARLDVAQATLDAYTETGDAIYALRYDAMDVDNSTGTLGLRLDRPTPTNWGRFTPQLRMEYQRDFGGRSDAVVRYADLLGGPRYGLVATDFDRNRFMLGLGALFDLDSGWGWRLEYNGQVGSGDSSDHGVSVNVQKQF